MKIPRKCHNHEAQFSRGTKIGRDEQQLENKRHIWKQKDKRKVQGVPTQSQTAALPRPQEEEETDKSKQAQIEQTYEKH